MIRLQVDESVPGVPAYRRRVWLPVPKPSTKVKHLLPELHRLFLPKKQEESDKEEGDSDEEPKSLKETRAEGGQLLLSYDGFTLLPEQEIAPLLNVKDLIVHVSSINGSEGKIGKSKKRRRRSSGATHKSSINASMETQPTKSRPEIIGDKQSELPIVANGGVTADHVTANPSILASSQQLEVSKKRIACTKYDNDERRGIVSKKLADENEENSGNTASLKLQKSNAPSWIVSALQRKNSASIVSKTDAEKVSSNEDTKGSCIGSPTVKLRKSEANVHIRFDKLEDDVQEEDLHEMSKRKKTSNAAVSSLDKPSCNVPTRASTPVKTPPKPPPPSSRGQTSNIDRPPPPPTPYPHSSPWQKPHSAPIPPRPPPPPYPAPPPTPDSVKHAELNKMYTPESSSFYTFCNGGDDDDEVQMGFEKLYPPGKKKRSYFVITSENAGGSANKPDLNIVGKKVSQFYPLKVNDNIAFITTSLDETNWEPTIAGPFKATVIDIVDRNFEECKDNSNPKTVLYEVRVHSCEDSKSQEAPQYISWDNITDCWMLDQDNAKSSKESNVTIKDDYMADLYEMIQKKKSAM